jgi:plastocyanin
MFLHDFCKYYYYNPYLFIIINPMKKVYTLLILLAISFSGYSTVHIIQVADFNFTPSMLTVTCGDTVVWNWVSGTHSTTSTSVPACAASWDEPITISTGNYVLTIPCAGTYNYVCSVHPMMTGSILATCITSVEEAESGPQLFFPNPFQDKINVTFRDIDKIVLYNVIGKRVLEVQPAAGTHAATIDTAKLPAGIYILSFYNEGYLIASRKVVRK